MALEDKERWNKKYEDNKIPDEPVILVQQYATSARGNKALDIACGMGRHSKYLASLGFDVDALDISSVAIEQLQDIPNIHAKEVDFDTYELPENTYHLIVCTYFLERKLFPQIIHALKPGGILLYETFLYDEENERAPSNPDFLLQKGELEKCFSDDLEIIDMREFWDKDYRGFKSMKASMAAKKKK
jgi:tellurite methyltransferase